MFADFLNLAGVNASPIACNVSNIEKKSLNYTRNTLEVSPYSEKALKEIENGGNCFNHYATLIEENSSYLIADITNDLNFKVEDLNCAKLIHGKAIMHMNPFSSFYERVNEKEEEVLKNFILADTYSAPYSEDMLMEERKKCHLLLTEEQDRLDACYLENKADIKHLAKLTNKIKLKSLF